MFFFKFSAFPFLKGSQNPLSNSKKFKGHDKLYRLLISKMENNYQISHEIKVLPIDPVFPDWVNFNKKVSIINCSKNSKSFKATYFLSKI